MSSITGRHVTVHAKDPQRALDIGRRIDRSAVEPQLHPRAGRQNMFDGRVLHRIRIPVGARVLAIGVHVVQDPQDRHRRRRGQVRLFESFPMDAEEDPGDGTAGLDVNVRGAGLHGGGNEVEGAALDLGTLDAQVVMFRVEAAVQGLEDFMRHGQPLAPLESCFCAAGADLELDPAGHLLACAQDEN
jgi:hypothetical protein